MLDTTKYFCSPASLFASLQTHSCVSTSFPLWPFVLPPPHQASQLLLSFRIHLKHTLLWEGCPRCHRAPHVAKFLVLSLFCKGVSCSREALSVLDCLPFCLLSALSFSCGPVSSVHLFMPWKPGVCLYLPTRPDTQWGHSHLCLFGPVGCVQHESVVGNVNAQKCQRVTE